MIGFVLEFCTSVHLLVNGTPVKRNIFFWSLQVPFDESLLHKGLGTDKLNILHSFWVFTDFLKTLHGSSAHGHIYQAVIKYLYCHANTSAMMIKSHATISLD